MARSVEVCATMMTNAGRTMLSFRAGGVALALAAILLPPLSSVPAGAQSPAAEPPPTCKPEYDWIKKQLPAGARIELLVAAGNTIPSDRWPSYKEAALAVLACAGDGATIELLPITDTGGSAAPVFVGSVPTPTPNLDNRVKLQLEHNAFVTHILSAIESLHTTTKKFEGFDPLGTLDVAGESLHRTTGTTKLVVVMIGNGWQQTNRVNLFRYHDNPANHANDVIRQIKGDGTLPNLAATDVVIAGITRGDPRLKIGAAELKGLCRFWGSVVRAGNGTMTLCSAVLPGMVAPLSRKVDGGRRSQAVAQVLR